MATGSKSDRIPPSPEALADQPANEAFPQTYIQNDSPKIGQSPCAEILCVGGGVCAQDRIHGYRCLCPLGTKGIHCQESKILL